MRPGRLLLAIAMCAIAIAPLACSSGDDEKDAPAIAIEGSWQMENYLDGDQLKPLLPGSSVTIEFGTERASGSAGVNDYSGTYSLKGDRIDFGTLTVTDKPGTEDALAQERAFLEDLKDARTFFAEGDRLELKGSGGKVLVRFTRGRAAELVGYWSCTGYGTGGALTDPGDVEMTADFSEEGSLSGLDGAGSYLGSYEESGGVAITISELEPLYEPGEDAALEKQGERFMAALGAAASYELGAGTLTLKNAAGKAVVTFDSAE